MAGRNSRPASAGNTALIVAATPMTARSLSPGLTPPPIQAGSAAIRCGGEVRRRAHGPDPATAADRRDRGTARDHLGTHRCGVALRASLSYCEVTARSG